MLDPDGDHADAIDENFPIKEHACNLHESRQISCICTYLKAIYTGGTAECRSKVNPKLGL